MKVFVINLERDLNKREKISKQLQDLSLDFELFKAVDGKVLTQDFINKNVSWDLYKARYRDFATLPALGCSLSHYSIYKRIVQEKIPYALILEDDALIGEIDIVKAYLLDLLESDDPIVILLTPDFFYKEKYKVSEYKDFSLYNIDKGYMTSGYLINNSAADLLMKNIFPISYFADSWSDFCKMGICLYGVEPHLISYPDTLGEIGLSQHNQNRSLIKKIRYVLARMKGVIVAFIRRKFSGEKQSRKKW